MVFYWKMQKIIHPLFYNSKILSSPASQVYCLVFFSPSCFNFRERQNWSVSMVHGIVSLAVSPQTVAFLISLMSTTPYSVVLGEPSLANSAPSPVDHQPFYKVAHGFTFHTLTILHTNVALPHKQSVLQYLAKLSLLPLILGLHNRANRGEINSGSV